MGPEWDVRSEAGRGGEAEVRLAAGKKKSARGAEERLARGRSGTGRGTEVRPAGGSKTGGKEGRSKTGRGRQKWGRYRSGQKWCSSSYEGKHQ